MTTVFLSGSRKIARLSADVRLRLDKIVEKNLSVVTGDANGADKAMQSYLADKMYSNVTIFYVGDSPRNNAGNWLAKKVPTKVGLKGRDFFAQKDKLMSEIADCGLVLWDGKSPGSVQNMLWLTGYGKKFVVYLSTKNTFADLRSKEDLRNFFSEYLSDHDYGEIDRKISFPLEFRRRSQAMFAF